MYNLPPKFMGTGDAIMSVWVLLFVESEGF